MTAYATNPAHVSPIPGLGMILGRLSSARRARRLRAEVACAYATLLAADDHRLTDLGVTRLDLLRMIADLDAR